MAFSLKMIAGATEAEKEKIANEIFRTLEIDYLPYDLLRACGYDFRVCSRVAYMIAEDLFMPEHDRMHPREVLIHRLGLPDFDPQRPLSGPIYMPVRYAGHIGWERIFVINRCAFPSSESLVGVRDSESRNPLADSLIRVMKGLKDTGLCYAGWKLYRLDPIATDDMTAMIALGLEKNFTLEFAHFSEGEKPKVLFRWEDS